MYKRSSLVKVTREGEQKAKQMNKNTKSTIERATKAAICSTILNNWLIWDLSIWLIHSLSN